MAGLLKSWRKRTSHSSEEKNVSAAALSKQDPTLPIVNASLATWSYASSPSPAAVRAVRWAIPSHHGDYESSDPFSLLGLSSTVVPAPSASWDPSWSLLT